MILIHFQPLSANPGLVEGITVSAFPGASVRQEQNEPEPGKFLPPGFSLQSAVVEGIHFLQLLNVRRYLSHNSSHLIPMERPGFGNRGVQPQVSGQIGKCPASISRFLDQCGRRPVCIGRPADFPPQSFCERRIRELVSFSSPYLSTRGSRPISRSPITGDSSTSSSRS